jgi:hypothetical protein
VQQSPKRVVTLDPQLKDYTGLGGREPYLSDLLEIIRRIDQGLEIPLKFYRTGLDTTPDELLEATGVKHLHLGGRGSNVLLYLVEYDSFVVLLEINDHKHFGQLPVGKLLNAALGTPLETAVADAAPEADRAARQRARAARLAKVRGRLKRN